MKAISIDLALRVATEHVSYRSLVAEIESDLERLHHEPGSAEPLRGLLGNFLRQMRRHFALEERGGLYDVYRGHDAKSRRHVEAMLAQHRDFTDRLLRLREQAETVEHVARPDSARSIDPVALRRLSSDLRTLFAELREHERAEDDLLRRLVEDAG